MADKDLQPLTFFLPCNLLTISKEPPFIQLHTNYSVLNTNAYSFRSFAFPALHTRSNWGNLNPFSSTKFSDTSHSSFLSPLALFLVKTYIRALVISYYNSVYHVRSGHGLADKSSVNVCGSKGDSALEQLKWKYNDLIVSFTECLL